MQRISAKQAQFRRGVAGAALLALAACGGPLNNAENCSFDVFTSSVDTQSTRKLIQLQGEMPAACETLTRENSGKLVVEVRVVGQENEDVALAGVQAGVRRKDFDTQATSLKVGSVDARFSSSSEPTWQVPWADAPELFQVALSAPLDVNTDSVPQAAQVKLSL